MAENPKPVYLVDAESDPVVIRIDGRASFQNSACLHDFFEERLQAGRSRFLVDFQGCVSMDSTFLGVLAGVALKLRKAQPPGTLVFSRVGPRNLELVNNLGLHRLVTIDAQNDAAPVAANPADALPCKGQRSEQENAQLVLAAHENLVASDEANRAKFQDVLTFLRARVEGK